MAASQAPTGPRARPRAEAKEGQVANAEALRQATSPRWGSRLPQTASPHLGSDSLVKCPKAAVGACSPLSE
eukprot:10579336-Alexandrium_andersonii.AAC.1